MDKTSGRYFVIRFFPKYLAIGQKSSKTVIAFEGKPISAYPLRLFLLSLGLTYGQDITSKAISKLVTLPREIKTLSFRMSITITAQRIILDLKRLFNLSKSLPPPEMSSAQPSFFLTMKMLVFAMWIQTMMLLKSSVVTIRKIVGYVTPYIFLFIFIIALSKLWFYCL